MFKAITVTSITLLCAFGQQPPAPDPAQPTPSPTAAQQQREKQIRMYDPLDKTNPLLEDQSKPVPDISGSAPGRPSQQPVVERPVPVAAPLPGSIAESNESSPANPRNQGPQVITANGDAPVQEYTGPAVLSRSYTIARPMVPRQVKWSPYLGYIESYDTGLTGSAVLPGGVLGNESGLGYTAAWGITGRHFWKFDQIGVDYRGSLAKIGSGGGTSGTNQTLNADYQHRFSRRLSLDIVTTGSILSQTYALQDPGLGMASSIANINLAASPNVQVLDQGTRQLSNQASLTWRKSARLSFNLGGGMFFVQRSGGFFGNTGYQSQADMNYRYTRKMTVGVYYSYTAYQFSHRINVSNSNTVGGIFSYALGRSTQIRLRAGVTRIENQGLQSVFIDPAIALLLGQSQAIIEVYHLSLTSDISAEVVKDFGRNRTASVSYVRGVSPGNGMLLTSVQEGFTASFGMRLFRHYSLSASGGRTSLSSAAQSGGKYDTQMVDIGLSRPLRHNLSADLRFDYRTFNISADQGIHNQMRISTGISWNPGEGGFR